jgi:hypothetical protein
MPADFLASRSGWFFAAMVLAPASLFAQTPDRIDQESLNSILLAISSPAPENVRQAEQAWNLHATTTSDNLARYAMALAWARNNRHQAAFDLIDAIPPAVRQAGPLRRLRIWLLIKLRKDEPAQAELESMITDLKTKATSPPSEKDLDDVRFLAKLVTHLERTDDRPDHLTRNQANAWSASLASLPEAWRKDLDTHRDGLLNELAERERKVKDTYQIWRTKTEKDLEEAQARLTELTQQEVATKSQLETETKAHQDYFNKVGPQIAALEAKAAPLIAQRSALRKPIKPRDQSTAGVQDPERRRQIQQANDRAEREYDRDLKEYNTQLDRLNAQIAPLERQAAPLYAQLTALKNKVAQTQAALEKIQKPLAVQTKNEQRLAKLLAEQPTWETAGNLAALRALEAYSILSFPAEVDRINRTRNK